MCGLFFILRPVWLLGLVSLWDPPLICGRKKKTNSRIFLPGLFVLKQIKKHEIYVGFWKNKKNELMTLTYLHSHQRDESTLKSRWMSLKESLLFSHKQYCKLIKRYVFFLAIQKQNPITILIVMQLQWSVFTVSSLES